MLCQGSEYARDAQGSEYAWVCSCIMLKSEYTRSRIKAN